MPDGDNDTNYINRVNAGVYAIRSNNRTQAFMRIWLQGVGKRNDQEWLNDNMFSKVGHRSG